MTSRCQKINNILSIMDAKSLHMQKFKSTYLNKILIQKKFIYI
jgi:hypothetical protein